MKQSLNHIAIWRQHRDARRRAHNAAVESRFAEPSAAQYNARKAPVASELNQEQQIAADERLARALMVEEEEQIAAEAEAARERQHEMERERQWLEEQQQLQLQLQQHQQQLTQNLANDERLALQCHSPLGINAGERELSLWRQRLAQIRMDPRGHTNTREASWRPIKLTISGLRSSRKIMQCSMVWITWKPTIGGFGTGASIRII